MTTDLAILQNAAITKEQENERFSIFLEDQDGGELDKIVRQLNDTVSKQIDCTRCGNCCRSLIINIEPAETAILSAHLNMPNEVFKEKFVEESQQGQLVINTVPCHFLHDSKCTIYEHRFLQCREFPHLHKNGFIKRFPGTLMHYGSCPIVYNVIEELKVKLSFKLE